MRTYRWMGTALLGTALVACSGPGTNGDSGKARVVEETGEIAFVMAGADTAFPHVRFPDGQVSLNDRCPVRQVRLNRRMPPVHVNGRPVGFC